MRYFYVCLISIFTVQLGWSQLPKNHELYKLVVQNDSLLFNLGFNNCDLSQFETLLSDDFEFYHDKAGLEKSKANNIATLKAGICGNPDFKSRRELVEGSIEVFPLMNNGKVYGLIQRGMHKFFETFKGKAEVAGSIAKFTHLWILEDDGVWRLQRVLSFDHQQQFNTTANVAASTIDLSPYVGNYLAPNTGVVNITIKENNLFLNASGMQAPLAHVTGNRFEVPGSPLEFEFVLNDSMQVTKFKVLENKKEVEVAIKQE